MVDKAVFHLSPSWRFLCMFVRNNSSVMKRTIVYSRETFEAQGLGVDIHLRERMYMQRKLRLMS